MPEQRFRLRLPTVAIGLDDTSKQIVKLPMGAEITVAEDDGKGLWITVNWTGSVFQMLTADFRNRSEPVRASTED